MKKIVLFVLKLGIAAGILIWLIRRSGLDFQSAAAVPLLYPALAVACIMIQLTLTIIRWYFLLRCIGIVLPFREILSLGMQGQFFSLFIVLLDIKIVIDSGPDQIIQTGVLLTECPVFHTDVIRLHCAGKMTHTKLNYVQTDALTVQITA